MKKLLLLSLFFPALLQAQETGSFAPLDQWSLEGEGRVEYTIHQVNDSVRVLRLEATDLIYSGVLDSVYSLPNNLLLIPDSVMGSYQTVREFEACGNIAIDGGISCVAVYHRLGNTYAWPNTHLRYAGHRISLESLLFTPVDEETELSFQLDIYLYKTPAAQRKGSFSQVKHHPKESLTWFQVYAESISVYCPGDAGYKIIRLRDGAVWKSGDFSDQLDFDFTRMERGFYSVVVSEKSGAVSSKKFTVR